MKGANFNFVVPDQTIQKSTERSDEDAYRNCDFRREALYAIEARRDDG